jgi:hypothetical protein
MRGVAVIRCWVLYALEPVYGIATRFVGVLGAECREGDDVVDVRVSWVPLVERGEWDERLHGRRRIPIAELNEWNETNNGIVVDLYPLPSPEGRDLLTAVEIWVEELLASGAGD